MPKPKPKPKARPAPKGNTPRTAFRLGPETLAQLDALVASYHAETDPALTVTRTDIIRMAIRDMAARRLK